MRRVRPTYEVLLYFFDRSRRLPDTWLVRRLRPLYQLLFGWVDRRWGIPFSINGVKYRIDPGDPLRNHPGFEAPAAALLRERVKPGDVLFDVGANVGAYVMQFGRWSHPTGRIFAFEPNPGARSVLHRHIRFNRLEKRVVVIPAAVGAAAGEAVLHAFDSSVWSRMGAPRQEIADRVSPIPVPVVTLDEYCEKEGVAPDWLLIDIEGFEMTALAGARQLIRSRGASLGIIVEMHPDDWHLAGMTRADVEAQLAAMGLRPVPLTGQRDPLGQHGMVFLAPVETDDR
jgi:FkbM family methyltransferase